MPQDSGVPEHAAGAGPLPPPRSVLDEVSTAVASARAGISGLLELMSLEARRASLALVWMVIWGFAASICIVAAWAGLMAVLALGVIGWGVHPIAAVLGIATLNAVAAALLVRLCIDVSRDLLFSATQRQLAPGTRAEPVP